MGGREMRGERGWGEETGSRRVRVQGNRGERDQGAGMWGGGGGGGWEYTQEADAHTRMRTQTHTQTGAHKQTHTPF